MNTRSLKKNSTPLLSIVTAKTKQCTSKLQQHEDTTSDLLSEEGRLILTLLSDKLDNMLEVLDGRIEKVDKLERENATLRRDLVRMEERIEAVETLDRRNNVIISGESLIAAQGDNLSLIHI